MRNGVIRHNRTMAHYIAVTKPARDTHAATRRWQSYTVSEKRHTAKWYSVVWLQSVGLCLKNNVTDASHLCIKIGTPTLTTAISVTRHLRTLVFSMLPIDMLEFFTRITL